MQDPQPKKGKKGRRRRNDSDEDIEKVLAELELEYSGQKKEIKDEVQQSKDIDEGKTKNEKKEQKKDKHEVQSNNDDVNSINNDTDEKKKKGKKGKRKEKNEMNDEIVNEEGHNIVDDDDENDGKKKKGKKGKKKEKHDVSDEIFNEEGHDIVEDEDDNDSKKKKGKKGKKKEKNEINDDIYNEEKHDIPQDDDNDNDDGKKIKDKKGNKKDKDALNDGVNHGEENVLLEEDDDDDDGDYKKKKKEKKDKKKEKSEITDGNDDKTNDMDIEVSTVKTAAQKKKEKKEREKQKKLAQKKAEAMKKADNAEVAKETPTTKQTENTADEKKPSPEPDAEPTEPEEGKKKKKKGAEKETKEKGKGPGKKTIAAMQEALKKLKEEEERLKREEEERIRQEELREQARLEQLRLEQERKEKKKLKEKQRKERLKAEGKLLTTKQKQDRARAQAMLEALKAQGLDVPGVGEKKTRPGTRIRPNKVKQQTSTEEKDEKKMEQNETTTETVQVEIVDQQFKEPEEKEEEVKDSWDAESSGDEQEEDKSDDALKCTDKLKETIVEQEQKEEKKEKIVDAKNESSESESESESGSESESEDESEEDSGLEDKVTDATRKKERARERIQNRRLEAEKKKSLDNLRAAVVCVLGHVDTGKTKILDKLRRTNVQDSEAGGITQQIGATNVPIEAIQESTKHVKGFADKKFKIPGLLIIDTPGHESFSNLRNRGSSLCDIAVLVVDIMHGLEPQTIESINLLKAKKCPFVVALNKIDRLYDWQTMNRKDVQDIVKSQAINTQREFEKRSKEVIVQFAEQGLNAALFYENPDPRSYVSLVPTSAITGEGMGNLLALIVDACQGPLAKRLMFSEELQATVLEVKALPGLGTTIDCILVNGTLKEGETMIVAGTDGPIVTQIRSLLMPQPLKELRVKNAYIEHREVKAAQGVKIAAKDLEKAIAGLNLQVAQKPDEVEVLKEEIAKELSSVLGNIRLADRGVYVQASTLGALEALLDFLKSSKIPYAGIRIGPVVKKDVMKASIMLEHDSQYATILAFDVKIERDAQELADSLGVKIFQADIIYHLFDKFTNYREELKQRKRDEHKHIAVFPCKLRVLPQYIFNSRDPIVMGVMVEAGIVKEGTPLCVPSKDFVELGVVTSIEYNHKPVETARKGQEVCIKIEPIPGEAPKMFGRHFDEKDFVISKISRQSIDACKEYFRDDLLKTDWQLMVELKKLFQIL